MNAIIYSADDGEVVRELTAPPAHIKKQALGDGEEMVVGCEVPRNLPEGYDGRVFTAEIPENPARVDPETKTVEVLDRRLRGKWRDRYAAAGGDAEAKADLLYERITGEQP